MDDDVRAVGEGADEVGRRQSVVDDQRHARAFGDRRDRLDIGDDAAGIGDRLDEDRLGLVAERAAEGIEIVRIGPTCQPKFLKAWLELVDRAAIELVAGNELVARMHQRVEDENLRRMA